MDALKQLGLDQALSLQWATEAPEADQGPSSSHSNGSHVHREPPTNSLDVGGPETQPGAPSSSSPVEPQASQPSPCFPGPSALHGGRQSPMPTCSTPGAAQSTDKPPSYGAADPGSDGKQPQPSTLSWESHAAEGSQLQRASASSPAKENSPGPDASDGSSAAHAAVEEQPPPLPGVEQLLVQLLRYDASQRHRKFLQVCTTDRWPLWAKVPRRLPGLWALGAVLHSRLGTCIAVAACLRLLVKT